MSASSFAAPRLRGLARRPSRSTEPGGTAGSAGPERCDLCAEALAPDHRHLLDIQEGQVSCACRACSLLFDRKESGGAHYRLLPQRRLRLDGCEIDDMTLAGLGVPVELAFFTRGEMSGEVSVGYPSPMGVLRSTVDPQSWAEVQGSHPALAGLADDVEALLVNRARGAREHWLVPLDDCYRLVALVRAHWKGLGGGPDVWQQIEGFFRDLSTDSDPAAKEASWPTST
ncbi:DUF5947 family protein [Streptomyces sp. NPDC048639]|uniref:DUF5947 family protein n=1 Tax=Streptomyces sp. NPDC048639 TaxID=3365581 RepID=UPI0037215B43